MEFKTFKTKLNAVIKSESTLRDNVQALAVSAIETFGNHGDTSRIEMLVNASIKMKSIRSQTLKEFIKAHANVKFTPVKDGVGFVVKKIGKGAIEVKVVESNWYDFDKVGVAVEKEAMKVLKGALATIKKAQSDNKLKTMTVAESKMVAQLESMLAA